MAALKFIHFALVFLRLSIVTQSSLISTHVVKAAYWPSSDLNFPPSSINTSFFTHIYYAFLNPNNVTFKLEISQPTSAQLSDFTATLRRKTPAVKAMFSIGGGGSDQDLFALIASTSSNRQIFIDSTINVARRYGFDGLDLDWEFPQSPKQMEDLGHLLQQWKESIRKEAQSKRRPPLLLTAAVHYSVEFLVYGGHRSYPVVSIRRNLDWVNVMCFDYHGAWDTSATGAHAAFFDPKTNLSSIYGLRSWIKAGVPSNQVVMGLPLYGKTWQLKDSKINGVGATAIGVGPGDDGVLSYAQVEEFNRKNDARVAYDVETMSVYSTVNSIWVGYDDAVSITTKIGFAQALGLRGYFFWAINLDSNWKISSQASKMWILHQ